MASSEECTLRIEDSAENWCRTVIESDNASFLWTIEKFAQYQHKTKDYLKSSNFQTSKEKLNWYLKLYPRGDRENAKDYVSIYLCWDEKNNKNDLFIKWIISIINRKGDKVGKHEFANKFTVQSSGWGYNQFIKRSDLFEYSTDLLPNGNLKLYCELEFTHRVVNISGTKTLSSDKVPSYDLSERIGLLFLNPMFSDVTLDVNGKEILAHKAILSAGSSVFAAMFANDMKENNENRVKITDIPYDVMKEVINFIYTGIAPNLKSLAFNLLPVADKYDLEDLKLKCEEEIFSTITVQNAADVLLIADRHNCSALKAYAMSFITDNCGSVKTTE